jgi:outer membrane immunogenic protein
VIGIEADYQWSEINGGISVAGGLATAAVDVERFGTVRGRLGYAWDRFMIYGTGGWVFDARVNAAATLLGAGIAQSAGHDGWAAGAGIEWAFAPNWSAKIEYLHIELDDRAYFTPPVCAVATASACRLGADIDLVRVGLNWRFGSLFGLR